MQSSTMEVKNILSELSSADNKAKNRLENELVNLGSKAIEPLVETLKIVKGSLRGIVAMTLIRIGEPSVAYLNKAAQENKDFEWVAKYLISEINLNQQAA